MQPKVLAQRTLARLSPAAAERLILQHELDYQAAIHADMVARTAVYRAAVEEGLDGLPDHQADHLRRVWVFIENRLAHGVSIFAPSEPGEIDLEATDPHDPAWWAVLIAPFDYTASVDEFIWLATLAGWIDENGNDLVDIPARMKALSNEP